MASLWAELQLGEMRLPCRLVRSATAERVSMDQPDDAARVMAIYEPLIEGGVGLLITGHIAVEPRGRIHPLMAGAFSDRHADEWRRVADRVHQRGGLLVGQINHGGGRCPEDVAGGPICVSAVPERVKDLMRGRPASREEIGGIVEAFARAAGRLRAWGFDGVQIHGAHGYLGSQFLSPLTNRRTDEWGGGLEGRARFLRETLRAVRREVGRTWPVGMKLGAADGETNGLTVEDAVRVAGWLQDDGLDFIEISGAFHPDCARRHVRAGKDEGYFLPLASLFKRALRIPVIAVGGLRSLPVIRRALDEGQCDAVAMSRPLIREPDVPRRLARGADPSCVGCNLCLVRHNQPTQCYRKREALPSVGAAEVETGGGD